jgi:copper chaperone CopZ
MSCSHCTNAAKTALEKVKGVAYANVSLENKTADVGLTSEVPDKKLIKAVKAAGFRVTDIK